MNGLPQPSYVMSEPHLSGYRVIIGYETLSDAQAAQAALCKPQAHEEAQPGAYDALQLKKGDEVWIRATVTDPCTSCCGVSVKTITGAVHGFVKPADVQTTPPAPEAEAEKLRVAVEALIEARNNLIQCGDHFGAGQCADAISLIALSAAPGEAE